MKYFSFASWALLLALLQTASARGADTMTVTAANPSGLPRPSETIAVPWSEIAGRLPGAMPDHLTVKNSSGAVLPTQYTNFHPENRQGQFDDFLFQHDFAAGEKSAVFTIEETPAPVPPFPAKAYARYIPERFDDFAWENDRIAHRIYGPGLESAAAGRFEMVSSGVDVWCKRVRYPVIDRWYLKSHDNYHKDTGEGLDMYETGSGRGCGGTGIWDGAALHTSHNWKTWKIMANGPIRVVFELTYEPWDGGGFQVSETKRFTVDAGHNLDRIESTFVFDGRPAVTVGIGLGKHKPAVTAETKNQDQAWMTVWEKYVADGQLGCGIVLAPGLDASFAEDQTNYLILTNAKSGEPLRYYAGAGWDRSGDFSSKEDWNGYVAALKGRLSAPVTLSYSPSAAPAP